MLDDIGNVTTVARTGMNSTASDNENLKLLTIFRISVLILCITGCFLNLLVFTALLNKKFRNQTFVILLINQTSLDLLSCILAVVAYSLRLKFNDDPVWMAQSWSFAVCYVFTSDNFLIVTMGVSNANLILIAFERYMKIVHSTLYQNYFRRWMIVAGIVMMTITGVAINCPSFWTTAIIDGQCVAYVLWASKDDAMSYAIVQFLLQYIMSIAIFIFTYGKIISRIRTSAKVFHGSTNENPSKRAPTIVISVNPGPGCSTTHPQTIQDQKQRNVVKTMLIITMAYVILWCPSFIWYLLFSIGVPMQGSDAFYYASIFLIMLNIWMNPFIYATSHGGIRKQLRFTFRFTNVNPAEDQTSRSRRQILDMQETAPTAISRY